MKEFLGTGMLNIYLNVRLPLLYNVVWKARHQIEAADRPELGQQTVDHYE